MKTNLNSKTSELEVIVAAKKEDWKKAQSDVEKKLISELSIKGFRKGKVPIDIAKKHIPQSKIMNESVRKLLDSLAKEAYDLVDKKTIILAQPTYLINKISDAELELKFVYPVYPKFKIGNYKGVKVKFQQNPVEKKTITDEINKMRTNQAMLKDKTGVIAKGDIAIIDYEGFVNGKTFEGGKGEKHQLEIGSNQFIPGFEDQLIGLKANAKTEVKVTFPKKYHDKKMQGKKAIFKVHVRNVKIKETPELNDEFAKTSGVPNVKTVAELKSYIQKVFEEQNRQEATSKFQREVFDIIAKESTDLVIPQALITRETEATKKRTIENMKKQGMDYKKYLELTGMKEEQFIANFEKQAKSRLVDAFLFAEIAKLEKIEVSAEDYKAKYKSYAKIYNKSIAEVEKMISKEQMQIPLTNEKVLNFLIKLQG